MTARFHPTAAGTGRPFKPSLTEGATPPLLSVPIVNAVVGHAHDANPIHRRSMEDALSAVPYDSFPGLFLGVYDGHGGVLAANLLRLQLHKHFLDELLALDTDGDAVVPATPPPSEAASDCSTPPYDMQDGDSQSDTQSISHPLNTRSLNAGEAFTQAYSKMDTVLKTRRCCQTGATAVTCFLRKVPGHGRVLTTANCGDSRAVLSRAGRPVRLSTDHRPVDEPEAKRILTSGGFIISQRVSGVLNVSRAFGDHCMKSVVISTPDVNEIVLGDMDDFVILACDGLWDFVDEASAVRLAQECFDRGFDSNEVAQALVQEALAKKSTDNISVMVVQFDVDEE